MGIEFGVIDHAYSTSCEVHVLPNFQLPVIGVHPAIKIYFHQRYLVNTEFKKLITHPTCSLRSNSVQYECAWTRGKFHCSILLHNQQWGCFCAKQTVLSTLKKKLLPGLGKFERSVWPGTGRVRGDTRDKLGPVGIRGSIGTVRQWSVGDRTPNASRGR